MISSSFYFRHLTKTKKQNCFRKDCCYSTNEELKKITLISSQRWGDVVMKLSLFGNFNINLWYSTYLNIIWFSNNFRTSSFIFRRNRFTCSFETTAIKKAPNNPIKDCKGTDEMRELLWDF